VAQPPSDVGEVPLDKRLLMVVDLENPLTTLRSRGSFFSLPPILRGFSSGLPSTGRLIFFSVFFCQGCCSGYVDFSWVGARVFFLELDELWSFFFPYDPSFFFFTIPLLLLVRSLGAANSPRPFPRTPTAYCTFFSSRADM